MAIALVASTRVTATNLAGGSWQATPLAASPTAGNLLIAAWCAESEQSNDAGVMSGWTLVAKNITFTGSGGAGGNLSVFYKVAAGGDTAILSGSAFSGSADINVYVIEWSGVASLNTSVTGTSEIHTTTPGQTITPTTSAETLIFTAMQWSGSGGLNTGTPKSGTTELYEEASILDGTQPSRWLGYRVVASPSGSYDVNPTLSAANAWHSITMAFSSPPVPGVWVDWNGDGFATSPSTGTSGLLARIFPQPSGASASDNITSDVIRFTWRRGSSYDHTSSTAPGGAVITVKNSTGKYNPDNASSVLNGLLRPGRPVWIGANADLTLSGSGQTVHGIFAGYLREIVPVVVDGATPYADLICDDALARYQRQPVSVEPSVTRSRKSLRTAILDAIGEASGRRNLDDEVDTLPFSAVDSTDALSVLEQLNQQTATRHWVAPADTKEEWYDYSTADRTYKLAASADSTLDGDDVDGLSGWRVTDDTIVDHQRIEVRPISLSLATTTVWESSLVPITVTNSQNYVVWAQFNDYVLNPAIQANVASGTISTVIEDFGRSAKLTITATSATAVLSSLIVTGQIVQRGDTEVVVAGLTGTRAGSTISGDFVGQPAQAQGTADFLVWKFSTALKRPEITVQAKNAATKAFVVARDLFDIVTVTIDRLSVSSRRFEVIGLSGVCNRAASSSVYDWSVRYELLETPNQSALTYFTLDTSSLDGAHVLAPW